MKNIVTRWTTALGLAGITAWMASWRPLATPELWWHLTFGRAADAAHAVPSANHLSYLSAADAPSFLQPWLAQWWLFRVQDLMGYQGLLTFRGLVLGAAVAFAGVAASKRLADEAQEHVTFGLLMLLGAIATGFGAIGPGTFGAALVGATLWTTTLRGAWRLVVIPIAALWVNVDWTFVTGALLLWGAAWEDRERTRWAALGGFLAATCISPRHVHVWTALAESMTWWQGSMLAIGFVAALPKIRVLAAQVGVPAAIMVTGAGMWNSAELAGLACVACATAGPAWHVRGRVLAVGVWIAAVAVAMLPSWQWAEPVRRASMGPAVASTIPLEAMDIMGSWGSQRRVYASASNAGLVAWAMTKSGMYPCVFRDRRPIDPKFDALERSMEREAGVWRGVFQQYGVEAALLELPRQERLAAEMAADDMWQVVWESPHMVLITR